MAQITIEKVAKLAGVSPATVSRALRSPELVRESTRQRILKIIKEKKYVYHALAADLSRQRSANIGLIIPSTTGSIFVRTVFAILEKAQEHGYTVTIGNSKYNPEIEKSLLRTLNERRPAGLLLTGFCIPKAQLLEELNRSGIPTVIMWEKPDDERFSYVGIDNYHAAYTMTEYLIGLKHRRIGLIIGPYSKVDRVRKRLDGYRDCLADHGLPWDELLVVEKEPTMRDGLEAMNRLMSLANRPTAVFAASDVMAFGAMAAAKEKGLAVPADVSIAGFDDIDFSAYADPPLTTIRVNGIEIGEMAIGYLLDMIENPSPQPRQICLKTDLIVRNSCRALE
ncbi:LacI family DNA-binding transcriptional regulator [uncultured Desulfosarcina sp.]|uniref:LacI family DNA-binding transcriptional regulator n=1 Tax=uncultured Desulfosarcina sp. TaxID=218289 RepID=UPI0029C67A8F|nr:LacI family DNA-binding transcriptional regulator [uncultured Desulfosarcina sp.]